MSRAIRFLAQRPGTVKPSLVYWLRKIIHGGNPTEMGRKVINPGDDWGSWSVGFYPPAMPAPITRAKVYKKPR